MKTTVMEQPDIIRSAAERIEELLAAKPDAVLALSASDDCLRLYRELDECLFSRARFFALTAFEGLDDSDPRSTRERLREALLNRADPRGERSTFLTPQNLEDYDALLRAAGGPDLVILGIGPRGRIGFNEPATPYDSLTHRQKLTKATGRELAPLFGGEEQVPVYGYTMGIQSILSAKRVLVFALGEERADPVFRMLYARTDSFVPAAFLQLSTEVEVFLDKDAAQKL